ncbi:hypothetical protein [Dictyobacter formicarum]|uniref:DUF1049 domain-containing protein n=1 Tax=Dictyobacter formicarum TaxID=2778368 RepID=A0ABQ3VC40_9CHLR|nr:hypothetical protein [Dictyobacter formicarum]GHO83720.1 hypothetical protein KSZ_17260 [Dictyobacter formicarum]
MKSTKLMLMGILLMLLAVCLATSISQALFNMSASNPPFILKLFPGIEAFLVVIGFVMGVVGFFQQDVTKRL